MMNEIRLRIISPPQNLAGAYAPATDVRCYVCGVTESKSSLLPGLLRGIIPLNLLQKAEKIGKPTVHPLSHPPRAHLIMYQVRSLIGG